jgi:hypothetical protein
MRPQEFENDRYEEEATRAGNLVQAGELDEAERILRSLPAGKGISGWLHEKSLGFINLAKARLALGQVEATKGIVKTVEPDVTALEQGSRWEAADCYLEMGKVMDRLKDSESSNRYFSRAVELAQRYEAVDVECRKILAEIARRFAAIGDLDRARSTAMLISYPPLRQITLEAIGIGNEGGES